HEHQQRDADDHQRQRDESAPDQADEMGHELLQSMTASPATGRDQRGADRGDGGLTMRRAAGTGRGPVPGRSEEHTSELQSRFDLVCRLLLEKKKKRSSG